MEKSLLREVLKSQEKALMAKGIPRSSEGKLLELSKTPFAIVISGVRRCGKSTLMLQLREKVPGHYINFDDDRIAGFKASDFKDLEEVLMELYGKMDVFYFDEVQNVVGWELFVRRLRDEGKKVFITGSNASLLSRELGTRLTGRYIQTELYPFSFKEYLNLRGVTPDYDVAEDRAKIKRFFSKYLKEGGMPEYVKTGNQEYLKSVHDNIIYRDVLVRHGLSNERAMIELGTLLASGVGKETSYQSLKRALGLGSATTVRDYVSYLESSYLIFTVPRFATSLRKQLYLPQKVYFIDNAMALSVGYRLSKDAGRLLENTVFLELKRRGANLSYFKGKHECDFVGKEAVQVCYELNRDNREREISGLLEAMKTLGLKKGLVLTYEQEEEIMNGGTKITIMPVWKWLLEG